MDKLLRGLLLDLEDMAGLAPTLYGLTVASRYDVLLDKLTDAQKDQLVKTFNAPSTCDDAWFTYHTRLLTLRWLWLKSRR